jgi:hypothetical protein
LVGRDGGMLHCRKLDVILDDREYTGDGHIIFYNDYILNNFVQLLPAHVLHSLR